MIEEPQVRSFNCTMFFNYKFVLLIKILNFPILDVFTQYLLVFEAIVKLSLWNCWNKKVNFNIFKFFRFTFIWHVLISLHRLQRSCYDLITLKYVVVQKFTNFVNKNKCWRNIFKYLKWKISFSKILIIWKLMKMNTTLKNCRTKDQLVKAVWGKNFLSKKVESFERFEVTRLC